MNVSQVGEVLTGWQADAPQRKACLIIVVLLKILGKASLEKYKVF